MEDVVIAGAGPNGLMLACELALAGVRPLILERLPEPTTENRANGLVGQVVQPDLEVGGRGGGGHAENIGGPARRSGLQPSGPPPHL